MHAVEGGVRCQYELLGTEHQLHDSGGRRSDDQQTSSRSVVHGPGYWKLSQFGTDSSWRNTEIRGKMN